MNAKAYKILCVEGTKGAGKSSTLHAIQSCLEAAGCLVSVCRPFAEASSLFKLSYGENATAYSLSQMDEKHAILADEALKNIVTAHYANFIETIKTSQHLNKGVMLMDRGWMTARCSLEDSCLSEGNKETRWAWWENNIPSTVFIYTKPDITAKRRENELNYESGLSKPELVLSDYNRRVYLKNKYISYVFSSHETVDIQSETEKTMQINEVTKNILDSYQQFAWNTID